MKTKVLALSIAIVLFSFKLGAISIVHGPYLQNVTADEATIVWISDSTSTGWVETAPDDGSHFYETERPKFYDGKNGIKQESRIHTVRLRGLKPGTTYRYRVYSQAVLSHETRAVMYGYIAATDVYRKEPLFFRTLDATSDEVRFSMVNDIHGNSDKLKTLLGHTDIAATDMVLFVGDMVTYFENEENVFGGFMDAAVELFASSKPMYYTRGNHETRGKLAYHFQNYFSPDSEHIYYMFRQGPVCFVALDCGEDKPDSDIEYFGITMYDQYRDEQAAWLEKVLQSEEYQSAPFKVITCHMPPRASWHGEKEVRDKFVPILEKYGADIMLCGHLHKYINEKAGELADFPVIINSSDAVLRCVATKDKLSIEAVDMTGKVFDRIELKK